ncbi:MAG: thiamine phosphate synthase, partial [Flavobacteriales bacterium]
MKELIVISPEQRVENEHAHINAMFDDGLLKFHVRKPAFNHDEMRQYLKEINPAFLDKVVIHSHYALADEFGLAGVHYTADYRK